VGSHHFFSQPAADGQCWPGALNSTVGKNNLWGAAGEYSIKNLDLFSAKLLLRCFPEKNLVKGVNNVSCF
jgi:hypothetical protein